MADEIFKDLLVFTIFFSRSNRIFNFLFFRFHLFFPVFRNGFKKWTKIREYEMKAKNSLCNGSWMIRFWFNLKSCCIFRINFSFFSYFYYFFCVCMIQEGFIDTHTHKNIYFLIAIKWVFFSNFLLILIKIISCVRGEDKLLIIRRRKNWTKYPLKWIAWAIG